MFSTKSDFPFPVNCGMNHIKFEKRFRKDKQCDQMIELSVVVKNATLVLLLLLFESLKKTDLVLICCSVDILIAETKKCVLMGSCSSCNACRPGCL